MIQVLAYASSIVKTSATTKRWAIRKLQQPKTKFKLSMRRPKLVILPQLVRTTKVEVMTEDSWPTGELVTLEDLLHLNQQPILQCPLSTSSTLNSSKEAIVQTSRGRIQPEVVAAVATTISATLHLWKSRSSRSPRLYAMGPRLSFSKARRRR